MHTRLSFKFDRTRKTGHVNFFFAEKIFDSSRKFEKFLITIVYENNDICDIRIYPYKCAANRKIYVKHTGSVQGPVEIGSIGLALVWSFTAVRFQF